MRVCVCVAIKKGGTVAIPFFSYFSGRLWRRQGDIMRSLFVDVPFMPDYTRLV